MARRNIQSADRRRRADSEARTSTVRGVVSVVRLWPVSKIKVGRRYRKELGDVSGLCRSIDELGLLHPVTITPDGTLLAGACRLAAVQKLGWSEIEVKILKIA